jgi:hypothetical protein
MRRLLVVAFAGLALFSSQAAAQGKGNKDHVPPGQAKKVTPSGAVVVTKEVLAKHGWTFVRVEQVGATQVIYYRRGNMGRGKGLGPIEKMVIRPSGDVVVFESAPQLILADIKIRLGL